VVFRCYEGYQRESHLEEALDSDSDEEDELSSSFSDSDEEISGANPTRFRPKGVRLDARNTNSPTCTLVCEGIELK